MSNSRSEIGVGQLAFTFTYSLPLGGVKDGTQETQDNGFEKSLTAPRTESKLEGKKKWHSLYDKVYAPSNLERAWHVVAGNKGAAGIDKVTIAMFADNIGERLSQLSQDLRQKTYRPKPVRRVYIPKATGGERPLGIPTVRDRIVQQALRQVLEPIFDPQFSKLSHGFRPERGCATALEAVNKAIELGYKWVVDADIKTFFDAVNHDKLLDAVNEEIADGSVLRLLRYILKAGVQMPNVAETEPTELGTPQGGPISPLLANIYLHAFDKARRGTGYALVRYADDFVMFTKSKSEAEAALEFCRSFLEGRLDLTMHPEKTRVVSVDSGFEFLGFHFYRHHKLGVMCKDVRQKSNARFRDSVRRLTPRLIAQKPVKQRHVTFHRLQKNLRIKMMIEKLDAFLRGWHWYFKAVDVPWTMPFDRHDQFIRRRMRSAIVGRTGSGWWNSAITNKMLQDLGLTWPSRLQEQYTKGLLQAPIRKD